MEQGGSDGLGFGLVGFGLVGFGFGLGTSK